MIRITNNTVIKSGVSFKEFTLQQIVYQLKIVNVPKIIEYNRETKEMIMQKINGDCLSNIYGENASDISPKLFKKVRDIIKKLYINNVEYRDITGYNFIKDKTGKIWVVDFEHAFGIDLNHEVDDFVANFMDGLNDWNPEFK